MAFTSFAELSQAPEVYKLVKQDIDRVNQTLPAGSRVKKYINLHKELDPDEGELTRTRTLRKAFLAVRYRQLIDAIYTGKPTVPSESNIGNRNGQTETIDSKLKIKSVEGAD